MPVERKYPAGIHYVVAHRVLDATNTSIVGLNEDGEAMAEGYITAKALQKLQDSQKIIKNLIEDRKNVFYVSKDTFLEIRNDTQMEIDNYIASEGLYNPDVEYYAAYNIINKIDELSSWKINELVDFKKGNHSLNSARLSLIKEYLNEPKVFTEKLNKQRVDEVNNLEIQCQNEEITEILRPHIEALYNEAYTANPIRKNRNSSWYQDKIGHFKVDILEYGCDISIYIVSLHNRARSILLSSYEELSKVIGDKDSLKIQGLIETEKADILAKEKSGYWKENPFNKVTKIQIIWSEAGNKLDGKEFKSFAEFNEGLRSYYSSQHKVPDGNNGYDKTKIEIALKNAKGEDFNISTKLDLSNQDGNFNPFKKDVLTYLVENYCYNLENPRDTTQGSKIYVDLSEYVANPQKEVMSDLGEVTNEFNEGIHGTLNDLIQSSDKTQSLEL